MGLFNNKKVRALEQQALQSHIHTESLQQQVKALATYISQTKPVPIINNDIVQYPDWNVHKHIDLYATSDHVYSVVNKIAETSSLIPLYVYEQTTDSKSFCSLKNSSARQFYTTKGIFDICMLQRKALEDVGENDELYKLLNNPMPGFSATDFHLANFIYYLLNGESIIYKFRLAEEDGANGGKISELHIWPPDNVVVHVSSTYPKTLLGYELKYNGQTITFAYPDEIIHWRKLNPVMNWNNDWFRGLSPLRAACKITTRLGEADIRALSQLKNGGLPGIVSDESIGNEEIGQPEFDKQKKAYADFITDPANHGFPFFTAGKKSFTPVGLNAADLKLLELMKLDFKRLCNVFKISDIVFNSDASSTESNVKEMIKQMITNACLPLVYSYRNALNEGLVRDFPKKKYFIDADISGITEIQDDMKDLANVISALPGGFTYNEVRELFKWDKRTEPEMDRPIAKQGYTFIDEMSIGEVDPNLLNG